MTSDVEADWREADPFDLPEWLGTGEVTWSALTPLGAGARVSGRLEGADGDRLTCDLLAVDDACPVPVAAQDLRTLVHRTWQRGEVLVVEMSGTVTLTVPGCRVDAEVVLSTIERLARAVGAHPAAFAVRLVVGRDARGPDPDTSTLPR